MEEISPLPTL